MNDKSVVSMDRDDRLAEVLDAYLAAQESGTPPDVEEFLARYPDLAGDLRECLASLAFIRRAGVRAESLDVAIDAPGEGEPAGGVLGDYRILREVGRGGMGVVYEAEQLSLGRRVALKVLPFAATMDPRHLQRFHNEARAAACLDHPHIVKVYAVGCERSVHYFAMKFIEGQSLAELIELQRHSAASGVASAPRVPDSLDTLTSPRAPDAVTQPIATASTQAAPRDAAHFRRIAEWGIQAAEALEHAHSLGIVHRDIKPSNLMIDSAGRLWVTDFGLARTATDAGLTMTGDVLGTLRYMSPEQALAKHGLVDHRTDIYALGATLYELLTFRPAVDGKDREEILCKITFEEPSSPRSLEPSIPEDVETIVLKALAKEPTERYATAQELADDLRGFLEDSPIRAKRPRLHQRFRKWSQRHRQLLGGIILFLLLAILVLVASLVMIWRAKVQEDEALDRLKDQQRLTEQKAAEALRERDQALAYYVTSLQVTSRMLHILDRKPWRERPEVADLRRAYWTEALRNFRAYRDAIAAQKGTELELALMDIRLGNALYGPSGDRAKAKEAFQKGLPILDELDSRGTTKGSRVGEPAGPHFTFGHWLAFWGEEEAARDQFSAAGRLFQRILEQIGEPRDYNNLAWFLATCPCAELRNSDRAVVLARESVARLPRAIAPLNTLGAAYYRAGRLEEAEEALRKAMGLHAPGDGFDWFLLALVCWQLGKKTEAHQWYKQAVQWMEEDSPDHIELRNLRREVETALGLQKATEASHTEKSPGGATPTK